MSVTPEPPAIWEQKYGDIKATSITIAPGDVAMAHLKPTNRNVVAYGLTESMSNRGRHAGRTGGLCSKNREARSSSCQ